MKSRELVVTKELQALGITTYEDLGRECHKELRLWHNILLWLVSTSQDLQVLHVDDGKRSYDDILYWYPKKLAQAVIAPLENPEPGSREDGIRTHSRYMASYFKVLSGLKANLNMRVELARAQMEEEEQRQLRMKGC